MRKLILVMAVLFTAVTGVKAQAPAIPDDPEVRKGVLPNGMTYYVRHNEHPAGQAEFYIFHNVGAVQEEDSQIGLAHFLEHMAFNGTKNLPDKQLIKWLESIGVKFGANLNASTGQAQTMYNVSAVPVSRESIVDSCLLILHDWSHFISLVPKEIDNERGVIVEELRARNSAGWRLFEKMLPYMYGTDTRYGQRNVIGTIEHLRTFSHKEIVDFYHRWYRPDLQCVVVVGDIDADVIVEKIKKLMADIPAVEGAPEKEIITLTPNDEPIIKIFSDPELPSTDISFNIGRDALPREMKNTMFADVYSYAIGYITSALNERLAEIAQKPNAPFTSAYVNDDNVIPTADALSAEISVKGTEVLAALEAVYTELQRMAQHGITVAEFERSKANFERSNQRRYDGRDDVRNTSYVYRYIANFRDNASMPDAETEYQTDKQVLDMVSREIVNGIIMGIITPENQRLFVTTPDKDLAAMPSEEAIAEVLAKVNEATIDAPQEEISNIPLISANVKLKGSKISKTETGQFGETIWTLKNGIKVIIKPTDFKKDEVRMSVVSYGGQSLVSDDMVFASGYLPSYFAQAGLGQFSATDLRKQLAGKSVSLNTTIGEYTAGFNGNASPKDLETLFQLLYLNFTAPRWNQEAFDVMIDKMANELKGVESNPQFILIKNLYNTMYGNNARHQLLTIDKIGEVTYERIQKVWKAIYAVPANFTIELVGNVNLDELKPLVEKYVGSLPKGTNKSKWIDRGVRYAQGDNLNRFEQTMQMPKTTIIYVYNGKLDYTLPNSLAVEALGQILRARYTESIREELGGAYSPQTQSGMQRLPIPTYQVLVYVETDPVLTEKVLPLISVEFEEIVADGVTAEELDKIKQYLLKEYVDDIKTNNYWIGVLRDFYGDGINFHDGYEAAVNALTTADIQAIAAQLMKDNNIARIIMEPKSNE